MKLKELAVTRKARKGPAANITRDGAYWLALDVAINRDGGDGIGQSLADAQDFLRVRHYRDGSLRAYCVREAWHQNEGTSVSCQRNDAILEAETIEGVIQAILSTERDRGYDEPRNFEVSDAGAKRLRAALPELPAAPSGPDEQATAPASWPSGAESQGGATVRNSADELVR